MKLIYSKFALFAVAASLLTLPELGAQTKKDETDPKPKPKPEEKCLDLVVGGNGVPRKGAGIFDPVGKGQCVRLRSRNCRPVSTGVWVKNLCCDETIWVKLSATKPKRHFDIRYQFGGKNVTGAITRGNFNVVVEGCRIVDGRIRIACARRDARAKRKLKKVLVTGYVVGNPFDRDGVCVKAKFR